MRLIPAVALAGSLLPAFLFGGPTPSSARSAPLTTNAVAEALRQIDPRHPRLFATSVQFEALRQSSETNELVRLALGRLRFEADAQLAFKPCERKLEGRRLLGVSRIALQRISVLALTFRLTGNRAYLDRAAQELRAAAAFSDWNPGHFLDVAEMTLALAIGYDWLYNDLDADTREAAAQAILTKGLKASLAQTEWVRARNNWGQVCHAGMLAGALALAERQEVLAASIVHRSIVTLPLSMRAFAPNGCYPEGPGYWSYGTDFNAIAIALLEGVLKSDFGLLAQPGFVQTADYLDTVTGPSGQTFNYADGGMNRGTDFATWWFAQRLRRPDLLVYFERAAFVRHCQDRTPPRADHYGNRLFALTLFWLQPVPDGLTPRAPLNWSSGGPVPITVHRTSWDNDRALFVGFKAGSPSAPHGHMDGGSFVLDALGVRWASDLGAENYYRIESRKMDLWNAQQSSDRWRIFRLGSLSHNTLAIDGCLQRAAGAVKVISFRGAPAPETVLDLSSLYTNATRVVRTGRVLPSGELQIGDALKGLRPGARVRWTLMTPAQPTLERHSPVAVLCRADKRLRLKQLHSPCFDWETCDAAPPPNEWDSGNPGFSRVSFEAVAPESGNLEFAVLFTPDAPAANPH